MQYQNNKRPLIITGFTVLILLAATIFIATRAPQSQSTEQSPIIYDPISHETYQEYEQEPEGDFAGTDSSTPTLEYLGFAALSNDLREDYYEKLVNSINEYAAKTFPDEDIKYVSLYEDSLKNHSGSDASFYMTFTIYFNSQHPTDITFETYPNLSIKIKPQK